MTFFFCLPSLLHIVSFIVYVSFTPIGTNVCSQRDSGSLSSGDIGREGLKLGGVDEGGCVVCQGKEGGLCEVKVGWSVEA